MSGNGMITSVWGKPAWFYLHCVVQGYPVNPSEFDKENGNPVGTTKTNYKRFITSVGDTLPCRFCRESYKIFIKESPPALESRDDLAHWLWILHNKVNEKIGKELDSDFDSVYAKYESFRAKCSKSGRQLGCTSPVDHLPPQKCEIVIFRDRCPLSKYALFIFVISVCILLLSRRKK